MTIEVRKNLIAKLLIILRFSNEKPSKCSNFAI